MKKTSQIRQTLPETGFYPLPQVGKFYRASWIYDLPVGWLLLIKWEQNPDNYHHATFLYNNKTFYWAVLELYHFWEDFEECTEQANEF